MLLAVRQAENGWDDSRVKDEVQALGLGCALPERADQHIGSVLFNLGCDSYALSCLCIQRQGCLHLQHAEGLKGTPKSQADILHACSGENVSLGTIKESQAPLKANCLDKL